MLTETRFQTICDQVVMDGVMGGFRNIFHGLLRQNHFRPSREGVLI